MVPNLQFLEQCLVRPLTHCVHRGTYIVQNAHDSRRVLMGPKQSPSSLTVLKHTMFIRSFLKQEQLLRLRYHLGSQSFPLKKDAINNPKWEPPLRSNDGTKIHFQKENFSFPKVLFKSYTERSLSAHSYCTRLILKLWRNHFLWPNSFPNVCFQLVTHIDIKITQLHILDTFYHISLFLHSTSL